MYLDNIINTFSNVGSIIILVLMFSNAAAYHSHEKRGASYHHQPNRRCNQERNGISKVKNKYF
jgi:hypothetical protein